MLITTYECFQRVLIQLLFSKSEAVPLSGPPSRWATTLVLARGRNRTFEWRETTHGHCFLNGRYVFLTKLPAIALFTLLPEPQCASKLWTRNMWMQWAPWRNSREDHCFMLKEYETILQEAGKVSAVGEGWSKTESSRVGSFSARFNSGKMTHLHKYAEFAWRNNEFPYSANWSVKCGIFELGCWWNRFPHASKLACASTIAINIIHASGARKLDVSLLKLRQTGLPE